MPSRSKQQQKFFGVVKAMQKGDIPKKGEAGEVADDMTKKEVDKMASTKHKGLVNKIKELVEEEIKSLIEAELPDEGFSDPEQMREAKSAKSLKMDYEKAIKKEQTLSSLMLANLVKYKQAKASGDEKAVAKYTKIAAQLSPNKRKASEAANKAYQAYEDKISGLHADAELELKEVSANDDTEFNITLKHLLDKHVTKGGEIEEEMDMDDGDYKYKIYVSKAFDKISDAMFEFRNAMGVKQLGQADPNLKKRLEAMQAEIFALRRDMKSGGLTESNLNEIDINDPILMAIRARKDAIAKEKSAPKVKRLSLDQYWKKLEYRSYIENQMKAAAEELEQLDSDMNQEAGQKGADWSDADANRYGGDLDKLQTKVEKLAKLKVKVNKSIMDYRMS